MFRKKIIFFCGLDRVGKTTTRKCFSKKTNEQHIVFDRSFIDNIVYDKVERGIEYNSDCIRTFFLKFSLLLNPYIVFMDLENKEINRRSVETEGIYYDVGKLDFTRRIFKEYLRIACCAGIKVIRIQCDNKTVQQIVSEIKEKI